MTENPEHEVAPEKIVEQDTAVEPTESEGKESNTAVEAESCEGSEVDVVPETDTAGAAWSVLGCVWFLAAFFIPKIPLALTIILMVAELALVFYWRKHKPEHSRRMAKGMVVGGIATVVLILVFGIIIPLILSGMQAALVNEMQSSADEVNQMMDTLLKNSGSK